MKNKLVFEKNKDNGLQTGAIREFLNLPGFHSIGLISASIKEVGVTYENYLDTREIKEKFGKDSKEYKKAKDLKKQIESIIAGLETSFTIGDCSRQISLDFDFYSWLDYIKEDDLKYGWRTYLDVEGKYDAHQNSIHKLDMLIDILKDFRKNIKDREIKISQNAEKLKNLCNEFKDLELLCNVPDDGDDEDVN